jgi:hypothetical protein
VEIVEMDDKELYVPDDVLEAASAQRGTKCCLKNQNYVIRKNWKNLRVNENQWAKNDEWKTVSEKRWAKEKSSPTSNYGYRLVRYRTKDLGRRRLKKNHGILKKTRKAGEILQRTSWTSQ